MNTPLLQKHQRAAAAAAAAAAALVMCMPAFAQAEPVTFFVPFGGAGNVSVFDPSAGSGGWAGSIEQTAPPVVANPLSLVSVVLFNLNITAQTLAGTFEFTNSADLGSTLFGQLTGSFVAADILNVGGQFTIDYTILGGTGMFANATGFGLSFVDYDPQQSFNNYGEAGLLNFSVPGAVPEPATWLLGATGLLLLAASRRKARSLN
jgi:PEP-CTERM motif